MITRKHTLDTIRGFDGMTASYSSATGEYRVAFKMGKASEASAYYTNDAADALATAQSMARTMKVHNKALDEMAADLFVERRDAMRHAIGALRAAGKQSATFDASTLELWLNELQATHNAK